MKLPIPEIAILFAGLGGVYSPFRDIGGGHCPSPAATGLPRRSIRLHIQ